MRRFLMSLCGLALIAATTACPVQVPRGNPLPQWESSLLVETEALARRLSDPRTVVLHVARDRAEYDAGHIPGARFVALGSILEERDGIPNLLPAEERLRDVFESAGVSNNSWVVLYGDLDGLAATRAFFSLDYLGKTDAALLDGGLERWRHEGRPLETAPVEPVRGRLTTRVRPDVVVDADWVRARLNDTAYVVIDARPAAEYAGEVEVPGLPRSGHIAGARNIFWRTSLVSDTDLRFRSPEVLHASFYLVGAGPGDTVVAYCRTGVQASHLYFQARYLRRPVVLYDGSFVDWSRRGEEYPVERGTEG